MPRNNLKVTDTPVAAVSTPRTLDEKIAATEALLAKYKQQKLTEAILNNIQIGDDVDFNFGRGESRRTLTGKVTVGITDDEAVGKVVAVFAGEGFDAKTYKVRVADITANRTAAERGPEEATEETAEAVDPLSV